MQLANNLLLSCFATSIARNIFKLHLRVIFMLLVLLLVLVLLDLLLLQQ